MFQSLLRKPIRIVFTRLRHPHQKLLRHVPGRLVHRLGATGGGSFLDLFPVPDEYFGHEKRRKRRISKARASSRLAQSGNLSTFRPIAQLFGPVAQDCKTIFTHWMYYSCDRHCSNRLQYSRMNPIAIKHAVRKLCHKSWLTLLHFFIVKVNFLKSYDHVIYRML